MQRSWTLAVASLVAGTALSLTGCSEQTAPGIDSPEPLVLSGELRTKSGLRLPAGTVLTGERDAAGALFTRFRLPDGYRLLARQPGGTLKQEPGGGISCTCTAGDGECMPFRATGPGGTVEGCTMNGCTECTQKASLVAPSPSGLTLVPLEDALVVNLNDGPRFIEARAELDELQCGGGLLLDAPELAAAIAAFVEPFQQADLDALRAGELPESYHMAPVRAFGATLWVPVQKNLAAFELMTSELMQDRYPMDPVTGDVAREPGGGGSCSCDSGDGSCAHKSKTVWPIGSAEWCDPEGCTTCTLS